MHNSKEELLKLFREGILASENDSPESFEHRINILKNLPTHHFKNPIFGIKKVHADVQTKKPMLPWFAALTKFEYQDEVAIPLIQISPFAPKETLDHEFIHAIKAPHQDSVFEEFLAFELSDGIRKAVGPLFFDPWEANILMISALIGFFLPVFWGASGLLFLFFCIRLFYMRSLYKKGLKEIERHFRVQNPLPIALLLTEKEFRSLAKREFQNFENQLKKGPIRHQQILALVDADFS
ncbi:MAG: hypothetical protein FJZ60_03850 [Chlamydiae bacterium]|nr:hypothetical protein [Chlamydiota bacterium]